jgi:hypothetical protein
LAAIAWRSGFSPRLSGYRVRPAFIAAAAASTMWAGVSKSGSPRINEMTVRPRAWTCRMSARIELTAVGLSSAARRERWSVVSRTASLLQSGKVEKVEEVEEVEEVDSKLASTTS